MATKEQQAAHGHGVLRIDAIRTRFNAEKNRAERPTSWVFFPLQDIQYLLECAEALQGYANPDQPGSERALTVVSEGRA